MVAALTARPVEDQQPVLAAGAFVFHERIALHHLPDHLDLPERFRHALAGHEVLAPSALNSRSDHFQNHRTPSQAPAHDRPGG